MPSLASPYVSTRGPVERGFHHVRIAEGLKRRAGDWLVVHHVVRAVDPVQREPGCLLPDPRKVVRTSPTSPAYSRHRRMPVLERRRQTGGLRLERVVSGSLFPRMSNLLLSRRDDSDGRIALFRTYHGAGSRPEPRPRPQDRDY